jgi:hypothetical protein
MIIFNVAKEFSPYPGGRKIAHGPYSGEEFLLRHLVPFWEDYDEREERIRLDFEDCIGCTHGFLDESLGELAKIYGKAEVLRRFSIVGKNIVEDIIGEVLEAAEKAGKFRTPELDKILSTKPQREHVQGFMEWCGRQEPPLFLTMDTGGRGDVRDYCPVGWQQHCTKWLGIDEAKAEQEKGFVLEQIRAMGELRERAKALAAKRGNRR